jgi:hypothetical protein
VVVQRSFRDAELGGNMPQAGCLDAVFQVQVNRCIPDAFSSVDGTFLQ